MAAAAQVVVNAAVLFLLYRFVKGAVGVDRFGVWSVVVGTTLSANVAEFGLSGATLRYVAHALGEGLPEEAAALAETAVLSAMGLLVVGGCVLYGPLWLGLGYVMRAEAPALLTEARALLPWTLGVLVLTGASASCIGALDGAQRVHVRSGLVVMGSLVLGAAALVLVPRFGLVGFVGAQAVQAVFLLAVGWALLRRGLPALSWLPHRWSRARFRRLIGYGMRWQAISLLMLLADPCTKALITLHGGLSYVGHYEFASKVAIQLRNVLAAMQSALLPHLTRLHTQAADRLRVFYGLSLRATLGILLLVMPVVMGLTPLVGAFWRSPGPAEALLVLLLGAWSVNLLSNPAYNEFAGRGTLGPNVTSHLVLAAANLLLGMLLGRLFGGFGVALAFALALVLGSLTTIGLYRTRLGGSATAVLGRYEALLLATGLLGGLAAYLGTHQLLTRAPSVFSIALLAVLLLGYGGVAARLLWRHPVRQPLLQALQAPVTAPGV